jgi:uncharacterized membrane protein YhfC
MILMPVALGVYLTRRFRMGWRLWWIGAGTFVLSQLGHIPFNAALSALFAHGVLPAPPESFQMAFNALVLGLSAGLWEEGARYLTYCFWAKEARSWSQGVMLGAGHGGIEAIILGVLVLTTFVFMVMGQDMDLGAMLSPEQAALGRQQLEAYWSMAWYAPMLGALERVFAMSFHLAASVLVLQVFLRNQMRWLWLAIGLHTLLDGVAVFAAQTWGANIAEVFLGVMAVLCLAILFGLKPAQESEALQSGLEVDTYSPTVEAADLSLPYIEETPVNLEQTRYQ